MRACESSDKGLALHYASETYERMGYAELERLGVRVVSGRLGRKAGDEDDGSSPKKSSGKLS